MKHIYDVNEFLLMNLNIAPQSLIRTIENPINKIHFYFIKLGPGESWKSFFYLNDNIYHHIFLSDYIGNWQRYSWQSCHLSLLPPDLI
jgi:hypothetical protein